MTSFSVLGYSSLLPVSDCAQDNDLDACPLGVLVGRPRNIPGVLRHGAGSRIPKEDKNRGLRSQAILHTRWAKYGSLDRLWLYVCLCVCHSQRQKCLFFAWGAPRGTLHLVPALLTTTGTEQKLAVSGRHHCIMLAHVFCCLWSGRFQGLQAMAEKWCYEAKNICLGFWIIPTVLNEAKQIISLFSAGCFVEKI